jgi:multidrug efflux pump subunit AcrA (membrane-fusion protein)
VITGIACCGAGGRVPGFGLTFALGIIPRFHAEMEGLQDLPRRPRLWVLATPLIVRLYIFSLGTLLWRLSRESAFELSAFSFTVAVLGLLSFFISANPLMRGDGYYWLSNYVGMPFMRGMAFRLLFENVVPQGRMPLPEGRQALGLRVYAIASLSFMVAMLGLILFFTAQWLELSFQGTGVSIFLVMVAALATKIGGTRRRLRSRAGSETADAGGEGELDMSEPAVFKRRAGRRRQLAEAEPPPEKKRVSWKRRIFWGGLLLVLIVVSLLPYPYETGGSFEIQPIVRQNLHAERQGVIQAVYYDGGEVLEAGTVVAKLFSFDQEQDVLATKALIAEARAELALLETSPRPEEITLKSEQLATARREAEFHADQLRRLERLYNDGDISEEEYETQRAKMEVAQQEAEEQAASLALVEAGPHPEEVEAVLAELERLNAKLRYHEEQLGRTRIVMPFDGRLASLNLKNLEGSFLDEDEAFAVVDDDGTLRVEIEVPEADIGEVRLGAKTRLKVWAYPDEIVEGEVAYVDSVALDQTFGKVVRVGTMIPNDDERLKPGMTGYGKIEAGTRPVIVAFTRRLVRFFLVEIWSWIP